MSQSEFSALIMAAGKGTRMVSTTAKVLHEVAGKPMLTRVIDNARRSGASSIYVIVGHEAESVRSRISAEDSEPRGVEWVLQEDQRGTGHAVIVSLDALARGPGTVLILSGDVPLLQARTLEEFVSRHFETGRQASLMTCRPKDATGYGRILRSDSGAFTGIVEHRDATPQERDLREINSGVYLFDREVLTIYGKRLTTENAQGEYYLTDIFSLMVKDDIEVDAIDCEAAEELLGINDRVDLAVAERILYRRNCLRHMRAGVTIRDPDHTDIGDDVEIGTDTVIGISTSLSSKTRIGSRCMIDNHVTISNSEIGDGTHVKPYSLIVDSEIGENCSIGPCTHLRPGSDIQDRAKVGNFVEIKKSVIGPGSKVSHLSYIGDASLGRGVNVGAGTITCNYDGQAKHKTIIGDDVFIGSDSVLVAPVTLGNRSYVAAASVITRDVPEEALAIARGRQVNKPGYRIFLENKLGLSALKPASTAPVSPSPDSADAGKQDPDGI